MGGVAKIYIIELRREKTFLQGHIISTLLEMFTTTSLNYQSHFNLWMPKWVSNCMSTLEFLGYPFLFLFFLDFFFPNKLLAPNNQIAFHYFSTCCLAFDNEKIGRGKEGRVLSLWKKMMSNIIFWGKCFGRPKKNLNIGQTKTLNYVGNLKFNMIK